MFLPALVTPLGMLCVECVLFLSDYVEIVLSADFFNCIVILCGVGQTFHIVS